MDDTKTYPGSKQTRRASAPAAPAASTAAPQEGWDRAPRILPVDGEEREFFTIGALAAALNREVVSIRKWESKGYLPTALYRTAGKKKDRLYTRAQIEGLIALAQEEGLMDPTAKVRVPKTGFPQRAHALFEALASA